MMNRLHQWRCSSAGWRKITGEDRLPWTLEGVPLGAEVLEPGPGYGAVTEVLRARVERLTCVEVDGVLAEKLRARMSGGNVRVVHGDGSKLEIADGSFDAAVCVMMLHHVPSVELQDRLLGEVMRVLRPGGWLVGNDGRPGWLFRAAHAFDTLVMVDPATLGGRLERAGFVEVEVDLRRTIYRFRGRKPVA